MLPTPESDNHDTDHFDQYLNSDVLLSFQGARRTGKVVCCKRNHDVIALG